MMRLKRLMMACTIASAAFAAEAQDVKVLEPLCEVLPETAVEREFFGYCADAVGASGQFAVSAAAPVTVEGSRYVNIYSIGADGKPVIDQTISTPEGNPAFFGFKFATTDDLISVSASTAKRIFVYRRIDGRFEDKPFAEIETQSAQVALAMTGNTLVYCDGEVAAKGDAPKVPAKLCVIDIDVASGTLTDALTLTDIKVTSIAANGDLIAIAKASAGIALIEQQGGAWTVAQTIDDAEHGHTAVGEHIGITDDEVILASDKQMMVYQQVDGQWTLTQTVDVVTSDDTNIRYGTLLKCNGSLLINGSNLSKLPASEPYGLIYRKQKDGKWTLAATFDTVGEDGTRDRITSACIVGNYFVSTYQMRVVGGLKSVGCFNLFSLTELTTATQNVLLHSGPYAVYDLRGMCLGTVASLVEAQQTLPRGLYIVGGQKIVVR